MDQWNCAALICCPPESPEQLRAIIGLLVSGGLDEETATKAAPVIAKTFDIVPAGMLQPIKDWVALLARGNSAKRG